MSLLEQFVISKQGKQATFSSCMLDYLTLVDKCLSEHTSLSWEEVEQPLANVARAIILIQKDPSWQYWADQRNASSFFGHRSYIREPEMMANAEALKAVVLLVQGAHSLAKRQKKLIVTTGRDGFLFYAVASFFGIKCQWIPWWSSNTGKELYTNILPKVIAGMPVFVDTGYSGSLFRRYEELTQTPSPFLLLKHSATASKVEVERWKEEDKKKLYRYRVPGVPTTQDRPHRGPKFDMQHQVSGHWATVKTGNCSESIPHPLMPGSCQGNMDPKNDIFPQLLASTIHYFAQLWGELVHNGGFRKATV